MKNSHGLTLIELMVTLAIFAIIAAMAFPGFRLYNQNSNRISQINDLVATFNMARSEAIKRNLPVIICASANQVNCSGINNWTTGWIAFVDDNLDLIIDATDGDNILNGGETAFYVHSSLSGANLVYRDVNNGGAVSILFNSRGMPTVFDGAAATSNFATFMRCDNRRMTEPAPMKSNHARGIILTPSGRTRLSRDGDNNGVQEDFNNANLVCP